MVEEVLVVGTVSSAGGIDEVVRVAHVGLLEVNAFHAWEVGLLRNGRHVRRVERMGRRRVGDRRGVCRRRVALVASESREAVLGKSAVGVE